MSQDTIESLRARVAELEVELENEQARGIHSCHPGCLRDGCVNRRLRDQLAAQALTIKTMREAIDFALTRGTSNICIHEVTHRGGAIWEICDQCGAMWADDEGGKPDFKWPEWVTKLEQALAIPDNSTEVLQERLDKQLGEPVVEAIQEPGSAVRWWWSDEGLALPKGTFLYRKPEIK